jgi:hypothetical protein
MSSWLGVRFAGVAWSLAAGAFLALLTLACGSTTSSAPPARAAGPIPADGGFFPPEPSHAKGIFVPADTGLGSQPTGAGQSTGTAGRTMAPTLGNPGN